MDNTVKHFTVDDMILSTLQVITFDKTSKLPNGYASGAIVRYNDQNYIISVAHVYNRTSLFGIIQEVFQRKPNVIIIPYPLFLKGLKLRRIASFYRILNKMTNVKYKNMSTLFEEDDPIDLLYYKINNDIQFKHFDISSSLLNEPKKNCELSFPITLNKDECYQLSGLSYSHNQGLVTHFNQIILTDLHFVEIKSDYYIFTTSYESDIKGCSGAPIFEQNGKIVSIVARKIKDKIWGTDINKLKLAFEISEGVYDE